MSSINHLVPGHIQQPFSDFRSTIYKNAKEFVKEEGGNYKSYTLIGAVAVLSKASEFVELPFKIIEDVALTLINLVGALFIEECRRHLKECAWQLFGDLGYSLFYALIAAQVAMIIFCTPPFAAAIPIAITAFIFIDGVSLGVPCLLEGANIKDMADYHRLYWFRTEAIRQCGYKKVAELEEKGMFPKYGAFAFDQIVEEQRIQAGTPEQKEKASLFQTIFSYFDNRLTSPQYAINAYKSLINETKKELPEDNI